MSPSYTHMCTTCEVCRTKCARCESCACVLAARCKTALWMFLKIDK